MVFHHDLNLVAEDVDAMQEVEVIGMDDGQDDITMISLSLPTIAWSPPMVDLSSSSASSSSSSSPSPSSGYSASAAPRLQNDCNQDEALETLLAMLSNESTFHTTAHRTRLEAACHGISSSSSSLENNPNQVNDHDRAKMCDWYYEMSDFLKIDRATASRSLAFLDRFMATPLVDPTITPTSTTDSITIPPSFASEDNITVAEAVLAASKYRDVYQLVALTALFLAIKLFERLSIEPSHVSYLSRGRYTAQEVVKMESIMLRALEWKVCSADKMDFVNAYLDVVVPKGDKKTSTGTSRRRTHGHCNSSDGDHHQCLKLLAMIQIQLSDCDSSFASLKPSLVAFAAVNNAFELKKDDMSIEDQHVIFESIQGLNTMCYRTEKTGNKSTGRDELAKTMERLRVLVDPTVVGRSVDYTSCSGAPSIEPTPTLESHQRYRFSPSLRSDDFSTTSADTQQRYVAVSPLDVALESIENFDVTQLFCCGSKHQTDHSYQSHMHGNNGTVLGKKKGRSSHRSVRNSDSPSPTSIISTTRYGSRLV